MTARRPAWTAEREVDAEQAAALVGAAFPDLRDLPVEPFATGWDHTVFLVGDPHGVGDRWAFRFPRREVALPGFARELAVLPRLARRLPLPVPDPVRQAAPTAAYPWPFAGSALLPGVELADSRLPDERRADAAAALGGFLRALHEPALAREVGDGLPVDPNRRADPAVRVPMTRHHLRRLADRGLPEAAPDGDLRGRVEAVLTAAQQLPAPSGDPVLVHGDLHVRHLLVDDAGRATGVIDWGDVCLADPAVDLVLAYAAFAGEARAGLLAAYGAASGLPPETELRARMLALCLSAVLAEYAATEGRAPLLAEALAGLGRAVS